MEEETNQLLRRYGAVATGEAATLSAPSPLPPLLPSTQNTQVVIGASHGQGAEVVFDDLYAAVRAAEAIVSGGYTRQSEIAATLAESYAGLAGKKVLDIECGYDSTSVATADFGPREIVAVDRSPA